MFALVYSMSQSLVQSSIFVLAPHINAILSNFLYLDCTEEKHHIAKWRSANMFGILVECFLTLLGAKIRFRPQKYTVICIYKLAPYAPPTPIPPLLEAKKSKSLESN